MALAASNGTRVSCPALIKGEAAQCACVIGGRTHAVCRSLLTYNLDEIKKDSKKNNYVFYFIFSELTCLGLDSYKSSRGSSLLGSVPLKEGGIAARGLRKLGGP